MLSVIGFKKGRASTIRQSPGPRNTAISNCSFEIVLDGKHTWVTPSLNASSVLLQSAVLIKVSTVDQYSTVMFTVPFFNPKEHLAVEIFFDGKAVQPHVWCRIENVQVRTRYGIKIDTYLDDLLPNTLWARLARAALKVLCEVAKSHPGFTIAFVASAVLHATRTSCRSRS